MVFWNKNKANMTTIHLLVPQMLIAPFAIFAHGLLE